jgi:hypothetical protein
MMGYDKMQSATYGLYAYRSNFCYDSAVLEYVKRLRTHFGSWTPGLRPVFLTSTQTSRFEQPPPSYSNEQISQESGKKPFA